MSVVLRLLGAGGLAFLILTGLRDSPTFALLAADFLFCWTIFLNLRGRFRVLVFLHPLALWISSLLFTVPFRELGDGLFYFEVVRQYVDPVGGGFESFQHHYGVVGTLKYLSLGVLPVVWVPDHLYGFPQDVIYYLWQGTLHAIMVAVCAALARVWCILRDDYLEPLVLFALVSPSFFDLGSTPTRHVVTFGAVFLFFVSFTAFMQRSTLPRLTALAAAVVLLAASKIGLLIPAMAYCAYYALFEQEKKLTLKRVLVLLVLLAGGLAGFSFALRLITGYESTASVGAATFAGIVQIPLVGIVFRYLFALVSPFPWHKAFEFIPSLYGGNWLLFCMHVLSALFGLYFFLRLALHGRKIFRDFPEARPVLAYGLIMSLSIIRGAIGFHTYILVFFPFLAPLFAIKEHRLPAWVPFGFALSLEAVYLILI